MMVYPLQRGLFVVTVRVSNHLAASKKTPTGVNQKYALGPRVQEIFRLPLRSETYTEIAKYVELT